MLFGLLRKDSNGDEERCCCDEYNQHRFHQEFSLGQLLFRAKLSSTKR
jgi:hypothetical protein